MRIASLVLLALLLFIGGCGSNHFTTRCEQLMTSQYATVVTSRQNGYKVDNSRSFRVLSAMHGPGDPDAFVLGLTKTESRMEVGMTGQVMQDPMSSMECVAPKIDVSLYYNPITIYVGSEFSPGTCAYEEILAHEMRHLKTYLDHLPKVERTVRTAFVKRFGNQPLYAGEGKAMASLKREIDTGWMPYIKSELVKVEKDQAAIDTASEYARLSTVCKGEVQSFIGPANRTRR